MRGVSRVTKYDAWKSNEAQRHSQMTNQQHTDTASESSSPSPPERLLTRREAVEYVRTKLGRPLTYSTMMKLCALGEGPPAAEYWGQRVLYRERDLDVWAVARGSQKAPPRKTRGTSRGQTS